MIRTISLASAIAAAALAVGAPAFGQSPDAFERAVEAQQSLQSSPIVSPDAVDRVRQAQLQLKSSPHVAPDAFERALITRTDAGRTLSFDDWHATPSTVAAPVTPATSGTEVEWPQLGIGFGMGVALVLMLTLGLRVVRSRSLAH
jgi:hypothetical protein